MQEKKNKRTFFQLTCFLDKIFLLSDECLFYHTTDITLVQNMTAYHVSGPPLPSPEPVLPWRCRSGTVRN